MKHRPATSVIRLPGAPAEVPPLPADLMQPIVDESHVAYFQPSPPPFYFLHSSHLPAGTVTPFHRHPCLALHGCMSGQLRLTTQCEYVLNAGTFLLIAPGVAHRWDNPVAQTSANFSLLIDQRQPGTWAATAGVKECVAELAAWVKGVERFHANADVGLKQVFWELADHLMAGRCHRATTTGLLLTLVGRLAERLGEQPAAPPEQTDAAETMRRLLLARIHDTLSVEEVAAAAHVSPTQAKRLFRATFGSSIIAYFNQMKIWQAKRLLSTSSLTVEQIARRLGYSTASYFTRAFTRAVGQPPSEFRQRMGP